MHSLADLVGLGLADYVVGDFRFWDLAAMSQRCDAEKAAEDELGQSASHMEETSQKAT